MRNRPGRYRWRTWLRDHEPGWLYYRMGVVVPKGRDDCGDHEFYNHDSVVDRCYHCDAGVRSHDPGQLARRGPAGNG